MTPEHIWVQRRVPKLTNYAKKYPGYSDHWDILKIPYANLHGFLNRKWLIVPNQITDQQIEQIHQDRLSRRTTKFGRLPRPAYEPQVSQPVSTRQHHQPEQPKKQTTTPPVTQKIITKEK